MITVLSTINSTLQKYMLGHYVSFFLKSNFQPKVWEESVGECTYNVQNVFTRKKLQPLADNSICSDWYLCNAHASIFVRNSEQEIEKKLPSSGKEVDTNLAVGWQAPSYKW